MKRKTLGTEKVFGIGELVVKGAKSENGTFEFIASGIKQDRYGDVVDPNGWDFKAFKKNPVMLWQHNSSIPAIAKVTKIWKDEKQVYAQAEWAPSEFAQEIRALVEAGFLNAVSVGFLPKDWEGEWPEYKYIEQELLEISVVNVPAYADALISHAKDMGLSLAQKAFEGIGKEEPAKEKRIIECVEMAKEGLVLHMTSGERKLFAVKDGFSLSAKDENVVQFTKEEFDTMKKELSQPLSSELKKQLSSLVGVLEGTGKALAAFVAESENDPGRKENEKKAPISLDVRDLTKIANKAIEMSLIQMRNDAQKK